MTGSDLPPRPDPDTGLPRPPGAPTVLGAWTGVREGGRSTASWAPGQPQSWFTNGLPMLELAKGRRRHTLRFVAGYPLLCGLVLALLAAAYLLVHAMREVNYPLASQAGVFGVIVVVVTLGFLGVRYLQQRTQIIYAGATWLGEGSGRQEWVDVYDLTAIDVPAGAELNLHLTGANKVTLRLPFGLLEANPALWDLVHNGLRHSVDAGAQITEPTRELLQL